ncbi:MAG: branched-chain amino acid ABC transporter substrate-binding protein [Actinomycetota bacterium]|nr:branched-chain amino acid ABC transporter substrate-binding protein [Actinomycetota bacterium]
MVELVASRKTGIFLVGALVALAGCGSSSSTTSTKSGTSTPASGGGNTVDIYSTFPLQGAVTAQTGPEVNGMKLALAQAGGKAGQFTVNFQSLDNATAQAAGYDPNQCQANARQAATDPKAVYLIGPQNSGCAKVQMPITNQAGLAQVSTANTYVGLTLKNPADAPGEPQIYYPSGMRNYLRIVPNDFYQGSDGAITMAHDGCMRVALANDKTPYGAGLATQIQLNKGKLTITGDTPLDPTAPNYRAYSQTLKGQGVNCVYTAFNPPGEVELVKDIHAALPTAKIYGGDGICTGSVTNPAMHGFPASIAPFFQCTVATQDLPAYPGGRAFLAAYKAKYGGTSPDPYAIYGYEAMKLGLDTIAALGPKGNDKAAVLAALFATKNRNSVLGTYGFAATGDTTMRTYGLYKVAKDGTPQFERTVTP